MAVLPLPLQVSCRVPPLMVKSPLESRQSPLETMVKSPPLMMMKESEPDENCS